MPSTKSHTPQIISRQRVADHGEVFTAEREVKAMCDLVKNETERIESRFLEPACGQGAVVSSRYAATQSEWERHAAIAVSSLYGIDILADNVTLCRNHLYDTFLTAYQTLFPRTMKPACCRAVRYLLATNILWGDALTLQTPDDSARPIVFAEWSDIGGGRFKRRDFMLANLLQSQPMEGPNLFSDLGDAAFIPTPVAEYPLVHYLKLGADEEL